MLEESVMEAGSRSRQEFLKGAGFVAGMAFFPSGIVETPFKPRHRIERRKMALIGIGRDRKDLPQHAHEGEQSWSSLGELYSRDR